jgi:hypothetical protein
MGGTMKNLNTIVEQTEAYITKYVGFPEDAKYYTLPLALYTIATHTWPTFDAFPYIVITAVTKRAGKTRLGIDVFSQICSNAETFSAKSSSSIFRSINEKHPTVLIDEAEVLNSEEANEMREVLNKGYRRGQTITKVAGTKVMTFDTYCPKVFILIGDVNDTLKDRSIIFWMRRGEAPNRFSYSTSAPEGEALREKVHIEVTEREAEIADAYLNHSGLPFLTDRDEEIWLPLFAICSVFAPHRLEELTKAAVDLSAEKTADIRRFDNLREQEQEFMEMEYAEYLLRDMVSICKDRKAISSIDAIETLKSIPTSPWRKFRGVGLTATDLATMLNRFGVKPKAVRFSNPKNASERNKSKGGFVQKGYTKEQLDAAFKMMGENKR